MGQGVGTTVSLGGVGTVKHFLEGIFSQVMDGTSVQICFVTWLQVVSFTSKQISWF